MKKFFKIAICVSLSLLGAGVLSAAHSDRARVDRLSRRSAHGHIAVKAGRQALPGDAEVSLSRTRTENVKRRITEGFRKRHGADAHGGRGRRAPNVLAMYDIAIRSGGRKWQPTKGDPVRVDVELDEPVAVEKGAALSVVHLTDEGEVEEL